MSHDFIARGAVLERCPSARCRRSGVCERQGTRQPCRRTHESGDGFRYRLARQLDRIAAAGTANDAEPVTGLELDCRLAEIKRGLEEREREWLAEQGRK